LKKGMIDMWFDHLDPNFKEEQFCQCVLVRRLSDQETQHTVRWLPEKGCRVGLSVGLREGGEWKTGWKIVSRSSPRPLSFVRDRGGRFFN
jgi:hypothetical protein